MKGKLKHRHRHRHRYRITRQRQHSLAVLRLSVDEARAAVEQQLQDNAALEQVEPDPVRYADYLGQAGNASGAERPPVETLADRRPALTDYLAHQLQLSDLAGAELELALQIAGNLDRDGYLRGAGLQELASSVGLATVRAEQVLQRVQHLDPVGVAARDLRECLLIQVRLRRLQPDAEEDLALVERIVSEHLGDLELKRYDVVAGALGVTLDAVEEAVEVIRGFNPRPGSDYDHEEPVAITPDVTVRKVGEAYVVEAHDHGLGRIRVASYAREVSEADAEAKLFFAEQLRKAQWLVKSIQERQRTIVRVTESIVHLQRCYLDRGTAGLRPLTLREVAEEVKLHPSTVSRATTNKYADTPRGLLELRSFFCGGVRRQGGGEVATTHVKRRIREIIAGEDKRAPLSDKAIRELLQGEGIRVVRRTVTKYRDQLGIVSSARRRIGSGRGGG